MRTNQLATWISALACLPLLPALAAEKPWIIDSQEEWTTAIKSSDGIAIESGAAAPTEKSGSLKTVIQSFDSKRSASTITFTQSPIWQNWNPIENLGPSNLADAPVLLTMGPDNY